MMSDPDTRHFCENGDTFNGWIGPDVHFLFSTIKGGTDCCWVLTHRDDADIEESWSFPGKLNEYVNYGKKSLPNKSRPVDTLASTDPRHRKAAIVASRLSTNTLRSVLY
jgi:hypothetical protein